MSDYAYQVVDAATGEIRASDLPLTVDSPIQSKLGDIGQWSAHLPADHPKALRDYFDTGLAEITVLRDEVAVANGPFSWQVDSDSRQINLTIFEPSAYLALMVISDQQTFNEDKFAWVRDVWSYWAGKTSTAGDGTASAGLTINAGWPNFTVSAGTSGFTLDSDIEAIDLVTFQDFLDKVAENPDEGIEWRVDISGDRSGCARLLKLGAPLGTLLTTQLTDWNLDGYGRSGDPFRAGTRAYVRGNGSFVVKQNTGSITDGWPLMEQVLDRGSLTDSTLLTDAVREFRRIIQPPVRDRWARFVPGQMLPFGFCVLGDTVPFDVHDPAPMLQITAQHHRVTERNLMPPSGDNPELVTLALDIALDMTGA